MSKSASTEIRWAVNAKTDSRPIIRLGVLSIGLVMAIFFAWGSFFELASAVITPGTLVSEGRNKLIQHSAGGRVKNIHVAEGDVLSKGQLVLELDPSQALADLSKLNARHASLAALKARLDAERSGGARIMQQADTKTTLNFGGLTLRGAAGRDDWVETERPATGLKSPLRLGLDTSGTGSVVAPSDAALMDSQRDAYASGRSLLAKEVLTLEQKIATLEKQRRSVEARISSQVQLLKLAKKEFARLKPLAANGYVARNRLDERKRAVLELQGSIASLQLDVESYDSQISEVRTQMQRARLANSDSAAKEYARIVAELAEVDDQRDAAKAVVKGLVVRSPVEGRLTNLTVTTVGGVFSSGDVIGEIVPADAPLLVEARVSPADINYIRNGQRADIAITAFDRRMEDMLAGEVVYVSADSQKDEKTGEQYFVSRLKLLDEKPGASLMLSKVQAGMQGEVYIHTGARTFLTYLVKPLADSFRRAFRER